MLRRIFPRIVDSTYPGHWLGIVLLVLVAGVKAAQGFVSMVNTHDTMINADGIPVDTFGAVQADTAIRLFSLLGMYLLVVPLLAAIALIRWRSLIPFVFLLLLTVQLGGRLIGFVHPLHFPSEPAIGFAGHPVAFWVNLGLVAMTAIGFLFSTTGNSKARNSAKGK